MPITFLPASKATAIFLMAVLLAGCLTPPNQAPTRAAIHHTYGLGLNLPEKNPSRSPFQENASGLQRLTEFLQQDAPRILDGCGAHNATGFFELTNQELYLKALRSIGWNCGSDIYRQAENIARYARSNHTEEQTFNQLLQTAEASVRYGSTIWDGFLGPANPIDAQVMYNLEHLQAYDDDILYNTATPIFQGYQKTQANETEASAQLHLENAYLSLLEVPYNVNAILAIVHEYRWSQGTCHQPDAAQLAVTVGAKLHRTLALASSLEGPKDPEYVAIGSPLGLLSKSLPHSYNFYRDHGFWLGILAVDSRLDMLQAYYGNFTRPAIPTREEAAYLIASYENNTRNLYTNEIVEEAWAQNRDPIWRETSAITALALPALHSPFQDLSCGPEQVEFHLVGTDTTSTETRTWENSANGAIAFPDNQVTSGEVSVDVRDSQHRVVQSLAYRAHGTQEVHHYEPGLPGAWTITISTTHFTGSMNLTFWPATSH